MSNQLDHPDSWLNSILEIIYEIVGKLADGTYIYRGEAMPYTKICSGLYLEYQDIESDSFDVETAQMEILARAKNYTDETDDLKILTTIQRYGGKTNLIEFTTDYLIALFFACVGSPDTDGRVILQKTEGIEQAIHYPQDTQEYVSARKIVFVRPAKGFIEPDIIINIPKHLKQPMLEYLRKAHGISIETTYNDLYGFVMSRRIHQSAYGEFHRGLTWHNRSIEANTSEEKQNAYERAVMHYTEALALKPDDAGTYYNRGLVYFNRGEYENAIADYNEAIQLEPNNANAYYSRGLTHFNKGEYDKAIADYNEAIQLEPNNANAYYSRGLTHFNKGEYDKAIADYNTAIKLKQDFAEAYNNLGFVHYTKGEHDIAISNFNIAIQLNPAFAEAYKNRGAAYTKKGDQDSAFRDYNTGTRLAADEDIKETAVKGFLHSMKLRFDEVISRQPYYRIFAIPTTWVPNAVQTQEKNIRKLLQNPPDVRKGAFGYTGWQEILPIPDGISMSGVSAGGGEITLLNNGFFELKWPMANSVFQWKIEDYELFSDSEWLYPYVVCEFPVTFLRLAKAIYIASKIDCSILVQQEYHNLEGFLLVGGLPGEPNFGKFENERSVYKRPSPIISKKTVNPNFMPDQVAYDFVTDVYTHFGLSTASIPPLFDEKYKFVL